ncbi:MAG: hypothetical protein V3V08_01735 [Nannocystaceae bacterium]
MSSNSSASGAELRDSKTLRRAWPHAATTGAIVLCQPVVAGVPNHAQVAVTFSDKSFGRFCTARRVVGESGDALGNQSPDPSTATAAFGLDSKRGLVGVHVLVGARLGQHLVVERETESSRPMEARAQGAARGRDARSSEALGNAVKRHAVTALGHDDVCMPTGAVFDALADTRRRRGSDDVLTVV